MARRLFTLLSAASLVLCAAACVLWVRSYWCVDALYHATGQAGFTAYEFQLDRGRFVYVRHRVAAGTDAHHFSTYRHEPNQMWLTDQIGGDTGSYQPFDRTSYEWLNFQLGDGTDISGRAALGFGQVKWLVVPLWAVAGLAAVLPVVWLARTGRRARRRTHGLCPACGYDLRASPGRCPECGAEPTTGAAA